MSVRAIDKSGDWTFGNSYLNYKTGQDEIVQNLKTRLLSWKTDCFFDMEAGVDWVNIIGSFNTLDYAKEQINQIILQTDGVVQINKLDVFLDSNRQLTIEADINTIYSTTFINYNIGA